MAAVAAAVTALSSIAMASPTGAASAPSQAATDCQARIFGITQQGKFLQRDVAGTDVVEQKATATALSYRPTNTGFFTSTEVTGGLRMKFTTIAPDGRPRILTVTDKFAQQETTHSTSLMLNRNFEPRLFTNSGGYHVFAITNRLEFKRFITYRNDNGRLFFGDPKTIPLGLTGLKTLSFYNRQSIGGVATDILYGTTKSGALMQIRVPVKRPANARAITIKQRGFGQYTGLSLGRCGDTAATAFIVAINANENRANRFILQNQARPSAANLSAARRMDTSYGWVLRATL